MALNVANVKEIEVSNLLTYINNIYYGLDNCEENIEKAKIASLLLFINTLCPDLKINYNCLYELIK